MDIEACHRILRYSTGVILAAFVLIILLTTFSAADWVLLAGKALYWLIVADAFASLGIWYWRTRLEKELALAEGQ